MSTPKSARRVALNSTQTRGSNGSHGAPFPRGRAREQSENDMNTPKAIYPKATLAERVRRQPASLGSHHYYLEADQPVRISEINHVQKFARCFCGDPGNSRISEDYFIVPLANLRIEPGQVLEDWTENSGRIERLIISGDNGAMLGALTNIVKATEPEGARIVGNGTLPHPLAVEIAPGYRLEKEGADFPPMISTLDQFTAIIEVTKQLAEAANIPGPLRAKCKFLCADGEEMIKRKRAFAAAGMGRETPRMLLVIKDGMAEHVVSSVPVEVTIFDMDAEHHGGEDAHEVTDPSDGRRRQAWINHATDHEVAPDKVALAFQEAEAACR